MANEMRDRLINSIETARDDWWEKAGHKQTSKASADYIADCLLDDGWVRPPCKVGQQVWYLRNKTEIIASKIEKIILKQGGLYIKLSCNSFYETSCNSIGKTIFFSVQELEQKLKEMRGE